MTPAQHRIVFAGFAAVAAGVAVNVALLQPSAPQSKAVATPSAVLTEPLSEAKPAGIETRRPADVSPPALRPTALRQAATPTAETGARRFARLRPDAAHASIDQLPDAPDAEGDPNTIGAVQRELSARGYGQLTSDGVPGLVTRAAIMAFEFDHKLPLKGEATATLLARIVLGSTGAESADPAAGRIRSPEAETVMRTVQQSLAALGYQVGKIDGKTGDDIGRAIREFELDEGLKPTGRISAEVFTRLGRVVASAKPKPIR